MQQKEINLIKMFQVLKTNQKHIWQTTAITTTIAIIYCMIATPIFTAKVIINPPKLTDAGNGMAQVLGDVSALSYGSSGFVFQKTDADTVIAMLNTDRLKNLVIKKFNLVKYYGKKDIELTRRSLSGAVQFTSDMKSGFVEIDVYDKDPKLAANIANYYVIALGQLISDVVYSTSVQRQGFFVQQLELSKNNLHQAQDKLKEFAYRNGIASGQQMQIAAGLITQLQAQLVVARGQLQAMSLYATKDNPDYKTLEATVDSLKKQLDTLSGQSTANISDQLPVPSNLAPELANQYTNLERDELMNEEILKVLFREYEASKIEGYSELAPTAIQVIDPALTPLYKSKPKRLFIIMEGFALGFLFGCVYFIVRKRKEFIIEEVG